MFRGVDFIFDNVPSETYGLKIGFFDYASPMSSFSGVKRSIEEYKLKRKSKPLFYGTEIVSKIEFDLTVYSEVELDTYDRQAIDNWLLKNDYRFFTIIQDDYDGLHFKCIITEGDKVSIGSKPYAKRLHFVCDDAYAYSDSYNYTYTSTSAPTNQTIRNIGNLNEYLYVEDMTITMTQGGNVSITNLSDGNRLFQLNGLTSGEIITVNNDDKILDSSLTYDRIGVFNKKWFRLVPYDNLIRLEGNFTLSMNIRFKMTI